VRLKVSASHSKRQYRLERNYLSVSRPSCLVIDLRDNFSKDVQHIRETQGVKVLVSFALQLKRRRQHLPFMLKLIVEESRVCCPRVRREGP
jgi:hypothetical protein